MSAEQQTANAAVVCLQGCVRGNNEDNFLLNGDRMLLSEMDQGAVISQSFSDKCLLFAVADGMGGGDLGERASSIAVGMLRDAMEELASASPETYINDVALRINRAVFSDCRAHGADFEGTTLAALTIKDGSAYISHIGDSRVYRMRGARLEQMTDDHSAVWEAYLHGEMTAEEARKSPYNNMITRYLGMNEADVPEHFTACRRESALPGDRFMLCSDGLSDLISNEVIARVMGREETPLSCAKALVAIALEEGGKDNVTCLVVDIPSSSPKPPKDPRPSERQEGTITASL